MSSEGYYRYATLSGNQIVFICEDELWSVSTEGGIARRLTTGAGECWTPRLSPDGTQIAFSSRDEGDPEVFIMPAEGGIPRRLTYVAGYQCLVLGWTPDGSEILFTSDAHSPFSRCSQIYAVSPETGKVRALEIGHGQSISIDRKGRVALGRNANDPARWKRYRGGTAGELWVDPKGNGEFRRLIELPGNLVSPMWVQDRIFFLSDHDGMGNIWSCTVDGTDLHRHTDHTEYYVRFPATDGKFIVYTAGGRIFKLDPSNDQSDVVDVKTPSPAPQAARKFVDVPSYLEHYTIHPDGHALGVISRGQPLTLSFFEGPVVQYGSGSEVRHRLMEWLPDGKRFVVVNDRDRFERLELHHADQSVAPSYVSDKDIGRVLQLSPSPKEDLVALTNHRHELMLLDLKTHKAKVLDRSPADRIGRPVWSADGRWMTYSWSPRQDMSIIRVVECHTGKVHDITRALRSDFSPAFDPDGRYIFLLSNRELNPIYDTQEFDLAFPMSMRPYAVPLRKDVPSPFAPQEKPFIKKAKDTSSAANTKPAEKDNNQVNNSEPEKNSKSRKETKAKGDKRKSAEERIKPEAAEVRSEKQTTGIEIDFDGIQDRMIAFPVEEGRYSQLVATKGKVLFTAYPIRGIPRDHSWSDSNEHYGSLRVYDLDEQKLTTLYTDVHHVRMSIDNQTLVYRSRDRLRVIDAQGGKSSENGRSGGWIDLSRASVLVEPRKEWTQMYREAWRLQKEQFWDESMSGVDWDLVFERYALLLPRIRTRLELSDLIWEMQGELGTSHAYEYGGDHRSSRAYYKGFLGADLTWDSKQKGYRIDKILRGDSWDRNCDSPLAEAGLNINAGDVIVAVHGRPVTEDLTVDELLLKCGDKHVQLAIKNKNGQRTVTVKTIRSERYLRYRAWVEANRRYVHEKTNGKVGYVHIPDMGPAGYAEFHRSYLSEYHREGLIVDVRYNGGGHVSALLLEKLSRKRVGYDVSRWGEPQPYPAESVTGPLVAITNQFAGSDGDIFSHCFKLYKLGPLVGKRTWGGVIGIWPRHPLADGTVTTQPEFSFWFKDVGWSVENYGTDPDYDVDMKPQDFTRGRDPQLDKSIELALQSIKESPALMPDFSQRPALHLPGRKTDDGYATAKASAKSKKVSAVAHEGSDKRPATKTKAVGKSSKAESDVDERKAEEGKVEVKTGLAKTGKKAATKATKKS